MEKVYNGTTIKCLRPYADVDDDGRPAQVKNNEAFTVRRSEGSAWPGPSLTAAAALALDRRRRVRCHREAVPQVHDFRHLQQRGL